MLFRINLFLVVLLFNLLSVSAQDIAIPYRDGEKWGMCNQDGKILIEPKYDRLVFRENYDSDFQTVYPKIKNKTGLIIKGKIIFDAKYSQIYEDRENYVLVSDENNNKTTEIVNKEGKSILKKPIIEIISTDRVTENLILYHVLNTDFTESVFLLSEKTNAIEQWMYEDYYSLFILKKVGGRYNLAFISKKTQNDALETDVWNFEKPPYVKTKKMLYETEENYLAQFYRKAKGKTNDYENGSSSGYSSRDIKGDVDSDYLAVEEISESKSWSGDSKAPVDMGEPNSGVTKKPRPYFQYTLNKENEKLFLETKQGYGKDAQKNNIPVTRKEAIKNSEIVNYYLEKNNKDSVQNFRNIAYYKTKNKIGVIFPTNTKKIIEFDTIVKAFNNIKTNQVDTETSFVVGNKISKTNLFKYSLYSNVRGLLFPIQFDEMSNIQMRINNGNIVYKTRIGNKFGLIESNGKELLKTEYEDFKHPGYNSNSNFVTKSYLLKKNNKFGLIYHNDFTYKDEIIDAIFDYEIDDVFVNYPNKKSNVTTNSKTTIVSLKNTDNEIIGYANSNGMLYFKN